MTLLQSPAALGRSPLAGPRGAKISGSSTPAPVGGWNARDAQDGMAKDEAIILDNWFPETDRCRLRRGSADHATGIGSGNVESLFQYASGETVKMLAAGNSAIYDASSAGAVGAALATSLTNNRWQDQNFKGNLFLVNGADAPKVYDGSTIANATISGSGLTVTDLIHVNVFKQRLFFIELGTLSFWYFAVDTISGTVTEFALDAYCKKGGYLVAMGSWTRDGGAGVDDLAVFVTSEGEALVFAGTDPGDSASWSLIGVFEIGAPLGRRCLMKAGPDLTVITEDGFLPMSKALIAGRTSGAIAVSDKIGNAVAAASKMHGGNFGWQPINYPRGTMALFNVPISENSEAHQYVMNTKTGAWCRFKGMNANCWGLFNDELYFGDTDGTVKKADTGSGDDGNTVNIEGDAKTSFQHYGGRGRLKRFTMVRPIISTDGNLPVAIDLNVDFEDTAPVAIPSSASISGQTPWGSPWGSPWATAANIRASWVSVNKLGYSAAIRMKVATKALQASWFSTDWLYEKGGFV